MKVVLPDSSELELPDGASGLEAARAIGPKLAEQAVLARVDGETRDLRLPLADGEHVQFLTTRDTNDPDALFVLRHSTAHLLAEAVMRLHPGVKIAIGPPIADGFYYDFEFPEPISDADLEAIEEEIRREIAEGREWTREELSREDARARFAAEGQPYKVELADEAEGAISLYTQGEFTDLCRGPHLQNASPIKAVKLTSLAGAYWRGDEHNTQLTRIYGTAFYSQADLDAHLERLEQARARDHRKLGVQLDLFHLRRALTRLAVLAPEGDGALQRSSRRSPSARERAARVRRGQDAADLRQGALDHLGSLGEVPRRTCSSIPATPRIRRYAIKPMNCPGHMLLFGSQLRSYRDLPIRYAEAAPLHRNELAGTLHGLTRVRYVTQDDAHIFCTREQIPDELDGCLDYLRYLYALFGVEPHAELSTRPDNKLGSDEEWDFTEAELLAALDRYAIPYVVGAGEGSFYGPKIDLHMTDVLGRSWQMGTIQLDAQMPARFGLTYMGPDNREHGVFVVHRALFGSFERFIGILVEHYAGAFPFWLSPVQARVIPVGESHRTSAGALRDRLAAEGYRVEVDERDDTLGKRIRDAEIEKVPFVVVYGDRESDEALAVRGRGGEQSTVSLDVLLARFAELAAEADPG